MKRGTPEHPKVFDLAEKLDVPRPTAIGYLELLWHFTAVYAPQGDIERFSDRRIEKALDWTGESGRLITVLVEVGWIDRGPEHQLVVHDWEEHCDDAVRKRLSRSRKSFVRVSQKVTGVFMDTDRTIADTDQESPDADRKTSAMGGDHVSLARARMPEPEPVPEPVPLPVPHASGVPRAAAVRRSATRSANGASDTTATAGHPRESTKTKPADKSAMQELVRELQEHHIEPGNFAKAVVAAQEAFAEWGGSFERFAGFARHNFAGWLEVWKARRERQPRCFVPQVAKWFESGEWLAKPSAESRQQNGRKQDSGREMLERMKRGEFDRTEVVK
jgi:hypothetical protein